MESPMLKMLKSQNPDKDYHLIQDKNGLMKKKHYY